MPLLASLNLNIASGATNDTFKMAKERPLKVRLQNIARIVCIAHNIRRRMVIFYKRIFLGGLEMVERGICLATLAQQKISTNLDGIQ